MTKEFDNEVDCIYALMERYPDRDAARLRVMLSDRGFKTNVYEVREIMKLKHNYTAQQKQDDKQAQNKRTIDDFIKLNPSPSKKFEDALRDLGDSWEYETEFINRCNLSQTEFRSVRGKYEQAHSVKVVRGDSRTVWAGTIQFANKLKEALK